MSSLAQHNSLNNISIVDELTLSELAAEKGPRTLGPNEITHTAKGNGFISL